MRELRAMFAVAVMFVAASSAFAQQRWTLAQTDPLGYRPANAANRLRGEYLVVWQEPGPNGSDIHGRFSRANNVFVGAEFAICGAPGEQVLADVAFDLSSRRYLVVWVDHRHNALKGQIWGQLVGETGALIGSNFSIMGGPTSAFDHRSPAVACDGAGVFMTVGLEYETGGGRYARVAYTSATGTVYGSGRISTLGGPWADLPNDWVRMTAAAADPVRRTFVAAWVEKDAASPTTKNIAYRRLGSGGDTRFFYASTAMGDEEQPGVSCDWRNGRTLIVWCVQGAIQVQGQFISTANSTKLGSVFNIASGSLPAVSYDEADGRHIAVWRRYVPNPQLPWNQQHQIQSRKIGPFAALFPISFVDFSCRCCGPDVAANRTHPSDQACYCKVTQSHAVWQAYAPTW